MFNTSIPADSESGAVLFGQIFENDKLNRALNDAAVLIPGLTRGKIVAWSATNSRWELYDGTVAPEATTMIGIVEYVGSPDTSGGVRVTGVYLDDTLTDNTAYYCQDDGTIGVTVTATFIGVCTDAGRLVMQGRGGGGGGGGAAIGLGNYIAEPFDVLPGTGLEVLINPNRCVIDETAVVSEAQTAVALTAKAAQLVYKTKAGTYDKQLPKMAATDLVDANTVGLWFPDGSASVPNAAVGVNGSPAVANALTKSGTVTPVDGWAGGNAAKGDGSNGYYTSANRTGFSTAMMTISGMFTYSGSGAAETIVYVGNSAGYSCLGLIILATGDCGIFYSGSFQTTGYILESGKPYEFEVAFDGTNKYLKINGKMVYTFANSTALVNDVFYIGCRYDNATKSSSTIHFIEVINGLRTVAQSAALAQKLLIPCVGTVDLITPAANVGDLTDGGGLVACWDKNYIKAMPTSSNSAASVSFGRSGKNFGSAVSVRKATVYGNTRYGFYNDSTVNGTLTTVTIQGSNDGSSFVDVASVTVNNTGSQWGTPQPIARFEALPTTQYQYWYAKVGRADSGANTAYSIAQIALEVAGDGVKTDIRNALTNPAESQIVCFTRTDGTKPVIIIAPNDPQGPTPERAYGMPIGPMGLDNKVKFLGWKYFSGATQLYWDNPFDTRAIKTHFMWAEDATGRNEAEVQTGGNYVAGGYGSTTAKAIVCYVGSSGAAHFNGAYKTSGYIGVYAEVID